MKYMGSKSKIAKYIVPIIEQYISKYNISNYIEPFVGGANVIDKVHCTNKVGADLNEYLIELYKNKEKVLYLPFVTKEMYSDVRTAYNNKDYSVYEKWYIGAVGFLASYNGRFFDDGYSGKRIIANGTERDYYQEALKNFIEQSKKLNGISFVYGSYEKTCEDVTDALIYCDPPYNNTKQYGVSKYFGTNTFWEWCRKMAKSNIVLVSEQNAPNDIECIWEQEVSRTIKFDSSSKVTEKIFLVK